MKKKSLISYFIFLFFPLGALILSIADFRRQSSKILILLFLVFFGSNFVTYNENNDSYRYAQIYKNWNEEINSITDSFLVTETTLDLAFPLIATIFSKITSDPRLFFAITALIFGFFYLKSISLLLSESRENKNSLERLLVFIFVLIINPIININGFRFYTGAWIYFYFVAYFLKTENSKYIFYSFLSILFHVSFILPWIILVFFKLLKCKQRIYTVAFIASFFAGDLAVLIIDMIGPYFGLGIQEKLKDYIVIYGREGGTVQRSFGLSFAIFSAYTLKIFFISLFLYSLYFRNKSNETVLQKNILNFNLILFSAINLFSVIPSFSRFFIIFYALTSLLFLHSKLNHLRSKTEHNFLIGFGILTITVCTPLILKLAFEVTNPLIFTSLIIPYLTDPIALTQILQ